jgi:large subunit ribosomal protein L4
MIRLALLSALSDRAASQRVALVDAWPWETPRTKDAARALSALGLDGRILVVVSFDDAVAQRSFANLPKVQVILDGELSAYDVLRNDWVVFTDETLPGGPEVSEIPPSDAAGEGAEDEEAGEDAEAGGGEDAPQALGEAGSPADAGAGEAGAPGSQTEDTAEDTAEAEETAGDTGGEEQ